MTDEKIEIVVANVLRAGVLLSAAIVAFGGAGYLMRHGHEIADYHQFHAAPQKYRNVRMIFESAMRLDWRAVIQLGLLLLIATPVVRVVISIGAFSLERDWTYVAVTAVVLTILIYSLGWPH